MTQEEKELLLQDLSARLPYGVKIQLRNTYNYHHKNICKPGDFTIDEIRSIDKKGEHIKIYHNDPLDWEWYIDDIEIDDIKPYLRPMSSMTDDEREEYRKLGGVMSYNPEHDTWAMCAFTPEAYDWLNKKQFDYRGLIPKGPAIEAPKDMYNN